MADVFRWISISNCLTQKRASLALHGSDRVGLASVPGVRGDPGAPGVSLPDVFRVKAGDLGDGTVLQRGVKLVSVVVDQRLPL